MSMDIMEVAKHEYAEDGIISSDTYMELNNQGFNADIVLAQLAGDLEDGEV